MAVVEALNSLGVSFSANPSASHSTQDMGSHLILAALAIQLIVIFTFVALAGMFHIRCSKAEIRTTVISTPLSTLYISMLLILVRSIYRLVEHLGVTTVRLDDPTSLLKLSPMLRYEWYFYVFDATMMLLNSALWNVWNPCRFLPQNRRIYLGKDGITQLEREENEDDRTLLAKVGSMFTFGLLFRKKKHHRLFSLTEH
jgi:hypothetical protein